MSAITKTNYVGKLTEQNIYMFQLCHNHPDVNWFNRAHTNEQEDIINFDFFNYGVATYDSS